MCIRDRAKLDALQRIILEVDVRQPRAEERRSVQLGKGASATLIVSARLRVDRAEEAPHDLATVEPRARQIVAEEIEVLELEEPEVSALQVLVAGEELLVEAVGLLDHVLGRFLQSKVVEWCGDRSGDVMPGRMIAGKVT